MADTLPASTAYKLLGGINQKASKYDMSTAQFLDLRNLDFDVPNALQKRPGSTFAMGSSNGTSGPITSLYEFSKLTGESYIIAGSDTAMFYIANSGLTLMASGYSNGQPTDMLTFVNTLFMANGGKYGKFDGTSYTPVGLPTSVGYSILYTTNNAYLYNDNFIDSGGISLITKTGGATTIYKGISWSIQGIYVAYSFLRTDGYFGPVDFLKTANNVVAGNVSFTDLDYFNGLSQLSGHATYFTYLNGFTTPSGYAVTSIALWVAVDYMNIALKVPSGGATPIPYPVYTGITSGSYFGPNSIGWYPPDGGINGGHQMSWTLSPLADLTKFHLFTMVPISSLFTATTGAGGDTKTIWATTFIIGSDCTFGSFLGVAPAGKNWSGMIGNFFATYIPKYQEIMHNTMFTTGYSASPSTVKFSEIGAPEVFMPNNTFEVRTNDGDRIYAIKAFNNQLVALKEHSFSKLIGSDADNYQLIDVSTDYGCLSNASVLSKDQTLFWLDRKGILEYNGANWSIISDSVEQIFRRMNISAAKEKAVGVHHMYRNQLWWGIPVDGSTTNNITVVYDYLVKAWTFFDGFSPSAFAYIKGAQTKPTAWRGDYSGMMHYTGESFYSDSGQGITCLGFTRFENQGGENQTTLWRRFFLDVATATGLTGTINGQVYSNYNITTVQATYAMYQDQFQSRAEMGIVGKAVATQFSHSSASLPLLINGYAWSSRGLRNV